MGWGRGREGILMEGWSLGGKLRIEIQKEILIFTVCDFIVNVIIILL